MQEAELLCFIHKTSMELEYLEVSQPQLSRANRFMKGNTHTRRNHFSYSHTTELCTEHSPDYCRSSLLAHFTAAATNTEQNKRMEINMEKGFLQKQEDF